MNRPTNVAVGSRGPRIELSGARIAGLTPCPQDRSYASDMPVGNVRVMTIMWVITGLEAIGFTVCRWRATAIGVSAHPSRRDHGPHRHLIRPDYSDHAFLSLHVALFDESAVVPAVLSFPTVYR